MKNTAQRAPRNRTITLSEAEHQRLRTRLALADKPVGLGDCVGRTICGDSLLVLGLLPRASFDLVIADPPYNLTKTYDGTTFKQQPVNEYEDWLEAWVSMLIPLLKPHASVYVCSEWRCSAAVQRVLERFLVVHNRITWEREKGRGALRNWKNCSEDIWFCSLGDQYFFNVDAVKQKRRVIAPYRDDAGKPKDWSEEAGVGFRVTHPSNLWTDISVPFWSMPENTDHPTQKPEKLIAKLILASSRPGDIILDPFLGSGTTSVVAKKLGRSFVGIEREERYCLLAEKRLEMVHVDSSIQGYAGGYFWDRNTLGVQRAEKNKEQGMNLEQPRLFDEQV